ncbi:MAG: hypothetical protein RL472_1553 [Pseudomonadota bacterium]
MMQLNGTGRPLIQAKQYAIKSSRKIPPTPHDAGMRPEWAEAPKVADGAAKLVYLISRL